MVKLTIHYGVMRILVRNIPVKMALISNPASRAISQRGMSVDKICWQAYQISTDADTHRGAAHFWRTPAKGGGVNASDLGDSSSLCCPKVFMNKSVALVSHAAMPFSSFSTFRVTLRQSISEISPSMLELMRYPIAPFRVEAERLTRRQLAAMAGTISNYRHAACVTVGRKLYSEIVRRSRMRRVLFVGG